MDGPKPVGRLVPFNQGPRPQGELVPFNSISDPRDKEYLRAFEGGYETPESKYQKTKDIINSIPDFDEEKKEILFDLAKKGASKEIISDAIGTLQGKHPHQEGGLKYYVDNQGIPHPLKNNEKPPVGFDVQSIWGSQRDANDDGFWTSLAKHTWNGVVGAAEGMVNLADMGQTIVTGEESENLQGLRNAAHYLKFKTAESENKQVFNGKGVDEWKDYLDPARYDFNKDNVRGLALQGLESFISFALGAKGFGAAGKLAKGSKELTKLESLAAGYAGGYNLALGEFMDAADEAGLKGKDKAAFATIGAIPFAALELFGPESQVMISSAAKTSAKEAARSAARTILKDEAGNITKEGLERLSKEMTVKASMLAKTTKNIGIEAATEPSQEFVKESAKFLYDKIKDEPAFKADPISFKSFSNYVNSAIAGAVGSFGPSIYAGHSEAKQEVEKKKSESAYFTAIQGEDAVKNFKRNISQLKKDGKLTDMEATDALTRVNAYKEYNDYVTSAEYDLNDEVKKEVFEKTFQKQNLESQIEGVDQKKLHPLEQASFIAKRKQADELQKDINDILLSAQVKKETVVADKIKEQEEESEEKPEAPKVKKPISERLKTLRESYKDRLPKESRKLEDVPLHEFNNPSFNNRNKHKIVAEHLDKLPEKTTFGKLYERHFSYKGKTNSTLGVEFGDGRRIQFASSQLRNEGFRGHFREERVIAGERLDGEERFNREFPVGMPIGLKVMEIPALEKGSVPKKVIKAFRADTGKFIGWAKETTRGTSEYSPEQEQVLLDYEMMDEAPLDLFNKNVAPKEPSPEGDPAAKSPTQEKPTPIRQLGTGSNVYFESKKYRVNDLKDGKVVLNVGHQKDEVPAANIEFDDANEAVFIARKLEENAPQGLDPDFHNISKIIENFKGEFKQEKSVPLTDQAQNLPENNNEKVVSSKPVSEPIKGDAEVKGSRPAGDKREQEKVSPDKGNSVSQLQEGSDQREKSDVRAKRTAVRKDAGAGAEVEEKLKSLNAKIKAFNGLTVTQKKKQSALRDKIVSDAAEIGYEIGLNKNRNVKLMKDGERVVKKSRPREKSVIQKEKDAKAFTKRAINAVPISVRHAVIQDIASGKKFNQQQLMDLTHIPAKDIPLGLVSEKGVSFEFYKTFLSEDQGQDNVADERSIAQQAADVVAEFATSDFRERARQEAESIYQEILNVEKGFDEFEQQEKWVQKAEEAGAGQAFEKAIDAAEALPDELLDDASIPEWVTAIQNKDKEAFVSLILKMRKEAGVLFDEKKTRQEAEELFEGHVQFYDEQNKQRPEAPFQKKSSKSTISQRVVEHIQKVLPKFNVVYDDSLKAAGQLKGDTILINPYYAGTDTPIHEAAHVLLDAMGENELVQQAVAQLKGTKLWNETKERYPELDEKGLANEVLAEAIGREGADIFESEVEKSKFQKILDAIFDWFKRTFGLEKDVIKSLARQIISGRGLKNLESSAVKEQLVGEKAKLKGMALMDLKMARKYESEGKSAREIRALTLWERSKSDGLWRYEINDDGTIIEPSKFLDYFMAVKPGEEVNMGSLTDVYNFPQLYDLYPGVFEGYDLILINNDAAPAAYVDESRKQLAINSAKFQKAHGTFNEGSKNYVPEGERGVLKGDILEKTLQLRGLRRLAGHELQHIIQKQEGFAQGSNPDLALDFLRNKFSDEAKKEPGYKEAFGPEKQTFIDNFIAKKVAAPNIEEAVNLAYKYFPGEIEARNVQTGRYNLTPEERRNTPLTETEDIDKETQKLLGIEHGKNVFQKIKNERTIGTPEEGDSAEKGQVRGDNRGTNGSVEEQTGEDRILQNAGGEKQKVLHNTVQRKKTKSQYNKFRREVLGRDTASENRELAMIREMLSSDITPEERDELLDYREQIEQERELDREAYEDYKKDVKELRLFKAKEDLSNYSLDDLIEIYNIARSYEGVLDQDLYNDIRSRIGEYLNEKRLDELRDKAKDIFAKKAGEVHSKDMTWFEKWTKALGDVSHKFPALQELSKIFDKAYLDMTTEAVEQKRELERLGKAVIKEKNKKLGYVGLAKQLVMSDSADYFSFVEQNGKLRTSTVGLTPAQKEYLEFYTKIANDRQSLNRSDDDMLIKVDRGFQETRREDGFMAAMSSWMGNNSEAPVTYSIKGNTETKPYVDAAQEILKSKDLNKVQKFIKLAQASYQAKKQATDPKYHIKNGILTSKHKDKTKWSKDHYRAAMSMIDDTTHIKHMNQIVPLVDSIEYFYKRLGIEDGKNFDNTLKFLEEWKAGHIYQESGVTNPAADMAMRTFRTLTSKIVMGFNIAANKMNIFMGNYNTWRQEGLAHLLRGQRRLFGGSKRAAKGLVSKKAMDLINKYHVVNIDYDSNPKASVGKMFDQLAFLGLRSGEYQIQGSQFLGYFETEDWKRIHFDEKGELVVPKDLEPKILEYKNRVSDVQGKYSEKDRRNFMRYEFGKSLAQFRLWMFDAWRMRFGAEMIDKNNKLVRGSFNYATRAAIEELKADWNRHGIKTAWKNEQTKKNLTGAMIVGSLMAAMYAGDDDKDKRKKAGDLENAISQLFFVFDPHSLKYMIDSPVASFGTVSNFINALDALVREDEKVFRKRIKKVVPYRKLAENLLPEQEKKK